MAYKYTEKKMPYSYFQWKSDVNQKCILYDKLCSAPIRHLATPSRNERVQCNKYSKSRKNIKGKRKLSRFLISVLPLCLNWQQFAAPQAFQLQQIDLVEQHMSLVEASKTH